ncbi:hypothetical protein BV898_11167 [Hypsibius exemplaris]|uniref:Tetraspanin n=1 Tax=Hypsibius exemplaris TaxID=2072580 RepID=A0A1W0WHH9_HYPEX|nr:hypothetical protein BV898_11167 [Hypsibius exemplaris]
MVHVVKSLSMGWSVFYVMLAFAICAVSISWHGDGVNTGSVDLGFAHFLEAIIVLGTVLAVVGFVGCIGSLNDSFYMTVASTAMVLLVALGFAIVSGLLSTQFIRAEGQLRMDMIEGIAKYSPGQNDTAVVWDEIQGNYNCCGIDTADDWIRFSPLQGVPSSCRPDVFGKVSFLPGCFSESLRPARKAVEAGVCTTAVAAGVLLIGFLCNVLFCAVLKRTRNKEL